MFLDNTKKISSEDLETLLEATRLSASSYGLQPYHIFIVENPETRKQLQPVSWNQSQITEASHLLVFANKETFGEELVDNYLKNVIATRGLDEDSTKGYSNFMKSNLMNLTDDEKSSWTSRQVYLALGNLMTVAADLQIDSCPIEGFEKNKYDEILGLEEGNLSSLVVLAIGYRSNEDSTQHFPKVRYPKEELFTHI